MFIVGINALARRNVILAGWISALPLVTILSMAWLLFDGRGNAEIAKFLMGVLWGSIPMATLLIATALLLNLGVPLGVAAPVGSRPGLRDLTAAALYAVASRTLPRERSQLMDRGRLCEFLARMGKNGSGPAGPLG